MEHLSLLMNGQRYIDRLTVQKRRSVVESRLAFLSSVLIRKGNKLQNSLFPHVPNCDKIKSKHSKGDV